MPHIRNGHTWIANELIEQVFAKGKFSKRESQIIWVILRESWGWLDKRPKTIKRYGKEKRKYLVTRNPISQTEFSERTSIALPHIGETIQVLRHKKIIKEHWGYYKFCKNYNSYGKKYLGLEFRKRPRFGRRAPNWQGGITPLRKQIRASENYKNWRDDVFIKDNFTCQSCGKRGGDLEAHHLKEFSLLCLLNKIINLEQALNCEELWDVNNGITLCQKCHDLTKGGSLLTYQKGNVTERVSKTSQNSKSELLKKEAQVTEMVTSTASKGKPKKKQRGLKESKERLNKERKMIMSQISKLILQFPDDLKMLLDDYIENARMENKTKEITLNKHQRLLNELWGVWSDCNIEVLRTDFKTALRITVNKQVPNINYLKKVMKNIANKRALRMKEHINGYT